MKASVILTTYNRPQLAVRAINSVFAQDYTDDIELIITDDNSNHETQWAIHERLKGEIPHNVNVIWLDSIKSEKWRNKIVTDYARNINSAILASTGDVLFYLTDDDEFMPAHVRILMEYLQNNLHADFVFGNQLLEEMNDHTLETQIVGYRIHTQEFLEDARCQIDHNQFAHRAETIEKVGLWPEGHANYGAGDAAFFYHAKEAGYKFYNATVPVNQQAVMTTKHRFHKTSVQGMMLRDLRAEW